MSNLSTAGRLPASPSTSGRETVPGRDSGPGPKAPKKPSARAKPVTSAAEISSSFSIQGAIGFLAGGLISLICIGASALEPFESLEAIARVAGYGIGGAIGGAALVWGSSRKHASRSAAFGFALAFLIPAWIAGPAVNRLLMLKMEAYGFGTFLATGIAFTIGFGVAGAIGGAFVMPRLFWAGMVRFGLAAAVGSAVAATVPSFNLHAASVAPQHIVGLVIALVLGHLIPFVLGGYWFGRAVEAEERTLRQKRPNFYD